jgi:DSF synthase
MTAFDSAVTPFNRIRVTPQAYQQLVVYPEPKHPIAWCYMQPTPRPCFTETLLHELNSWFRQIREQASEQHFRYHVIASRMSEIYNLGGDLQLFRTLIQQGDREALLSYGRSCIEALYANISGFGKGITTISLVQGDALGGGFEAALSSDVLIAESGAKMGFPEILFNLFPGMGAFSLLSRKLDAKRAERIILSGKLYSAEELYDMGLVDILTARGEGEMAVYDYVKREERSRNGYQALRRARDAVNPITYEELSRIVEIWVDAALKLGQRDLKMMERLVSRQEQVDAKAA